MFDDANINFMRDGGGVYQAGPGLMMPINKES